MKLVPTDAALVTNDSQPEIFGCANTSKRALSTRGWCTWNRVLLQHPEIRDAMKKERKEAEKNDYLNQKNIASSEAKVLAMFF